MASPRAKHSHSHTCPIKKERAKKRCCPSAGAQARVHPAEPQAKLANLQFGEWRNAAPVNPLHKVVCDMCSWSPQSFAQCFTWPSLSTHAPISIVEESESSGA